MPEITIEMPSFTEVAVGEASQYGKDKATTEEGKNKTKENTSWKEQANNFKNSSI